MEPVLDFYTSDNLRAFFLNKTEACYKGKKVEVQAVANLYPTLSSKIVDLTNERDHSSHNHGLVWDRYILKVIIYGVMPFTTQKSLDFFTDLARSLQDPNTSHQSFSNEQKKSSLPSPIAKSTEFIIAFNHHPFECDPIVFQETAPPIATGNNKIVDPSISSQTPLFPRNMYNNPDADPIAAQGGNSSTSAHSNSDSSYTNINESSNSNNSSSGNNPPPPPPSNWFWTIFDWIGDFFKYLKSLL